jgi:hypothetical protein
VIFLTLNVAHNYYQIPVLAPFALWLGAAIDAVRVEGSNRWRRAPAAATLLLVLYALSSVATAAVRFYRIDPLHRAIGRFVRAHTSEDDLVVMAYTASSHGDPSFLFYARRYGWSVGFQELSPSVLDTLQAHGATAVVTSTLWPPGDLTRRYLAHRPTAGILEIGGGHVRISRLTP